MHLRKLVLCFGLLVLALSQQANALGLGELQLNSALNQPLDAEIELLQVGDLGPGQISVALASEEAHARVGVIREHFYSQFRFDVDLENPDGALITITSREPVREPYLNLLIEVRWTAGRLLREYTVLLDLPVYDDEDQPDEVAAPQASEVDSRTRPAAERTPPASAPAERADSVDSYTVQPDDTLWEVALDVRPDGSVSVQQTMLALQEMNPDAFINNNINLLREGHVLRVPSAGEVRSLNAREAMSRVANQNEEWADAVGLQMDATAGQTSAPDSPEETTGRVRLATPGADDEAREGRSDGASADAERRALENELAATQEELDRVSRDNTELSGRVEDLEEQIETMERLLELSNEELRALQLAVAEGEADDLMAAAPEDEAAGDDDAAGEDDAAGDEEPAPEQDSESAQQQDDQAEAPADESEEDAAEAAPAAPSEETADPEPPAPTPTPAPAPTLMDRVMDNILWLGLLIAAALAIVLVVYHRRQLDKEFDEDDFELDALDQSASFSATDDDAEAGTADQEESALDIESDDAAPDTAAEEPEPEPEPEQPVSAEAETGDVAAEAEIYIAYRQYDQAEEMLRKGLDREPGSTAIMMKLLEVYAGKQDHHAFDEHYAQLLALGDSDQKLRAEELRAQIPGAPAFDSDAHPVPDVGAQSAEAQSEAEAPGEELELGGDLDLSDDELNLSDEELDLDDSLLDEGSAEKPADESTRADSGEEEEDFSFDFELDDDGGEDDAGSSSYSSEEEPLLSDDDLDKKGGDDSDYDLSFDEEDDKDRPLEFSLEDDEPAADSARKEEAPAKADSESDTAEEDELGDLDFDLGEDDLEDKPAESAPAAEAPAEESDSDDDDLDFDADVGDVDLEALDKEMASLDADEMDSDTGTDSEPAEAPATEASEPEQAATESEGSTEDAAAEDTAKETAEPAADRDATPEAGTRDETLTRTPAVDAESTPDREPGSDEDMDEEMDFLSDADEAATKLDLARAYIDMGDSEGAKDILSEVVEEGNDDQRREAEELLTRADS